MLMVIIVFSFISFIHIGKYIQVGQWSVIADRLHMLQHRNNCSLQDKKRTKVERRAMGCLFILSNASEII